MIGLRATEQVAGGEFPERRILRSFVRYGVLTQPASSVRGSSRRITIMRFRPADIRVINRRNGLSSYHLLSCSTVYTDSSPPGFP